MKQEFQQRGFVALISVIVISAVLLSFMASVGLASFYARFDALGIENKREATALAESCANTALLALSTSTDPAHYDPSDQAIVIGTDAAGKVMTCIIKDAIHTGSNVTISTYASSGNSFSSVSVVAALSPKIELISWDRSL
jgi:hypothetical protein